MFKYNNTHIFTGYLKQLLSSVNIPTCKIYTKEFARYAEQHNGEEDPRVIESFDTLSEDRLAVRINYLIGNELYNYLYDNYETGTGFDISSAYWKKVSTLFYSSNKCIPGLTKTLYSPGHTYDKVTHEYLGDYLRFVRDYYDVNLMSLYNCFNNDICNNLFYRFVLNSGSSNKATITFDSQDSNYKIYAIPVKLFENYTIAIDCNQGVEMFCGLYNNKINASDKFTDLAVRTYRKISKAIFKQPYLFDGLSVKYWSYENDMAINDAGQVNLLNNEKVTRHDIINYEQDLKLFVRVPTSCKSSIVILEGDYRHFNDFRYIPKSNSSLNTNTHSETWHFKHSDSSDDSSFYYLPNKNKNVLHEVWKYEQNHSIVNFGNKNDKIKVDINSDSFKPIGKIQLLAFNTGESYPFSDRLIEYLSGSAISPTDEIPDNIKRVQSTMKQNKHRFKIDGLWENKMQKIAYDYLVGSGPIEYVTIGTDKEDEENLGKIVNKEYYKKSGYSCEHILLDKRNGYHPRLGHRSKSTLYDTLGYIDKDTEKWYAGWHENNEKAITGDSIQNIDIYDKLYDI